MIGGLVESIRSSIVSTPMLMICRAAYCGVVYRSIESLQRRKLAEHCMGAVRLQLHSIARAAFSSSHGCFYFALAINRPAAGKTGMLMPTGY